MRILCADIGTGTQDILLYDSRVDIENGFKLVVPSPTMMVHRRLKGLTRSGEDVLLSGLTMGGGPSQWAVEGHIKAGNRVFATPDAARSFNDDLAVIREMGIIVVGEEEAAGAAGQRWRAWSCAILIFRPLPPLLASLVSRWMI